MIGLTSFLSIHILTVLLFVFGYLTRTLETLCLVYAIMTIHELAHLFAALLIGLRPQSMTFYPFGVNLKLKNTMIYSISEEVILYLAGPCSNLMMALFGLIFFRGKAWFLLFYHQNIGLCLLNLLPVIPLDGGVILKKLLARRLGFRTAERMMRGVSAFFVIGLCFFEGALLLHEKQNFSVLIFCVFLLGNIFCTGEKYNIDFIRELIFYKEKGMRWKNRTVRTMVMREGSDPRSLAESFTAGHYYIIFCIDQAGKLIRILTETEFMEKIFHGGNQ